MEKKSIFKSIFEKPWEESQSLKDNEHDGKAFSITGAKLGIRTVMVVSTVIFSLFVVTYADRMLVHDWRSMPEPFLLWVNTMVLILNSYFFHKVKIASDNGNYLNIKRGLYIVGFLAYLFLFGQLVVWYQLVHQEYSATSNIANTYFYLLTTLHGLHLMGGLFFWGRTMSLFIRGDYKLAKLQHRIELCAIYWHFLLIVWFVLFGLMLFT